MTVLDKQKRFQVDVEVPTNINGKKLAEDIMEVLNEYYPEIHLNVQYHCFLLNRQGRVMADDETLVEAGIWNGDYITIISRV